MTARRWKLWVPIGAALWSIGAGMAASAQLLPGSPVLDRAAASRFVAQTTFGPTTASINQVALLGRNAWLAQQLLTPATLHLPRYQELVASGVADRSARYATWWETALTAPDQLRQRLAFALSQIFVVSENDSTLVNRQAQLTDYYDLLVSGAFGNYRDLLEAVTLSQAMGLFLSHLGNDKPNPTTGQRPDENFAREVMQLFSIGLWELNRDGSPRLDSAGEQIPTYDQAVIESYARVYTGWTWAHRETFGRGSSVADETFEPMKAFPDHHDSEAKTLIDGSVLPAGQTPEADLAGALDSLFEHDNLPPFIARQLIIKLVTSNPSADYIDRVAAVFENNGVGVRGDLGATVAAIFLDPEARFDAQSDPTIHGKLKEPILRLSQLFRAFDASSASGIYGVGSTSTAYGQTPLSAPSVFNFFSPNYQLPGAIEEAGYYSPEFQMQTETQGILIVDDLAKWVSRSAENAAEDVPVLDLSPAVDLAADADALVDELDVLMLGGAMSPATRTFALELLSLYPDDGSDARRLRRAQAAVTAVVVSPDYAIQR